MASNMHKPDGLTVLPIEKLPLRYAQDMQQHAGVLRSRGAAVVIPEVPIAAQRFDLDNQAATVKAIIPEALGHAMPSGNRCETPKPLCVRVALAGLAAPQGEAPA